MSRSKKVVLLAVFALFTMWSVSNFGRISANDDWILRFVLGTLFALLIVLRPKGRAGDELSEPVAPVLAAPVLGAAGGAVLSVLGIVFGIHQFEWLGIVLLLCACLIWALPAVYGRDVLLAMFILYWVHPLPGQVFGKLEILLQWISVHGSERLLHCFNQRVWADGMILHTGLSLFGVPEACSGMRTAVTVMMCVLGTGMLMRLRWFYVLLFLFLGVVQVMVLNVLRISFMVIWADNMPAGWSKTFLHDSLGIFLLISILLVQMEVAWWRWYAVKKSEKAEAIEQGVVEPEDRATIFPKFWQLLFNWWKYVLLSALVALGMVFMLYKQRPFHRATMFYDVTEGLIETDPALAQKAIDEALALLPGDRNLTERRIQVLIAREKPQLVLDEIDKLGVGSDLYLIAMKSWALMCVGRVDEAAELIKSLPEESQSMPRVAMIKAEYAAAQDRPDEVRMNLRLASADVAVMGRIRKLFVYLASHGMWDTISESDNPNVPYSEFPQALIAIKASIVVNKLGTAGTVMRYALEKWPDEIRLMTSLFELAKGDSTGGWTEIFADRLCSNIDLLDIDRLAVYIDYALQLKRPDLGWLVYAKLRDMDPHDPMVYLALAQHYDGWFIFRNHYLGLKGGRDDVINIRPFCRLTGTIEPYKSLWELLPVKWEMPDYGQSGGAPDYLSLCLAELKKREKENSLSRRMEESYPMVLALSGDFAAAHLVQERVAEMYPDRKAGSFLNQAKFYSWEGRWGEAYEALRGYYEVETFPSLEAEINFVNVLMSLDMGIAAMHVAERTGRNYPEAVEVQQLQGLIWNAYGFKEDALYVLQGVEQSVNSRVMVQLLIDSGRAHAAQQLKKVAGINFGENTSETDVSSTSIVPAEAAIAPVWPPPLTDVQMNAEIERLEGDDAGRKSHFLEKYNRLVAEWYRKRGVGDVSGTDVWVGIGRDDIEKVSALSRLASILARQKDRAGAMKATSEALELMPTSAMLQRMMIGLSEGRADVVNAARGMCPHDSDIWLASLILRCKGEENKEKLNGLLEPEMREVVKGGLYSVGAVVRASDYLLRQKLVSSALILARYGVEKANGYVPAYISGMKCALQAGDTKLALRCALSGAENASDPTPFYRMVVMIKSVSRQQVDSDLVRALQYLEERFPQDQQWTAGLGYAYFMLGDTAKAKAVLSVLVRNESIEKTSVGSLMLAAEAARQVREIDTSVRILKNAYLLHPDNFKLLNNLVYNLAQNAETIEEAKALLPKLLESGENEFIVYDTAAMVYLRSGEIAMADRYMAKALELLDDGSTEALEIRLNAAEVMFRMGEYGKAKMEIQQIRKTEGISNLLSTRTLDLLTAITKAEGEGGGR